MLVLPFVCQAPPSRFQVRLLASADTAGGPEVTQSDAGVAEYRMKVKLVEVKAPLLPLFSQAVMATVLVTIPLASTMVPPMPPELLVIEKLGNIWKAAVPELDTWLVLQEPAVLGAVLRVFL